MGIFEIHDVLKHSSVISFISHQLSFKRLVTLSHQHSKKDTVSLILQGVLNSPGQTQLQRMPLSMKSAATDLVSPITAALEVL